MKLSDAGEGCRGNRLLGQLHRDTPIESEDPRERLTNIRAERSGARGRIAPESPERSEGSGCKPQERVHAVMRARPARPLAGRGPPRKARPPQGGGEGKNILTHYGSEARLQTARNASALEPVGSKPTESRRRTAARSSSRMAGCERAKRASTESTRRRTGGLPPVGLQPLEVEHGCSCEGCRDRAGAAPSALARSLRPKQRNRCGTVRRGIGGNQEPPSERSERGNLLTGWVGCFLVVGHRRESVAPERAKRARVGRASEGTRSPRASEASEGLSTCARVCVRVFRAGAYGQFLCISGF